MLIYTDDVLYSYKIIKTIFLSKCYNATVSQAAFMNNPIESGSNY